VVGIVIWPNYEAIAHFRSTLFKDGPSIMNLISNRYNGDVMNRLGKIRPILNGLSDYVGMIATNQYRLYLKEEERQRRHSEWMQYIIAAILWLVKLISNSLENVNIKSKRVIEKVTVE
jgi:septin family protein